MTLPSKLSPCFPYFTYFKKSSWNSKVSHRLIGTNRASTKIQTGTKIKLLKSDEGMDGTTIFSRNPRPSIPSTDTVTDKKWNSPINCFGFHYSIRSFIIIHVLHFQGITVLTQPSVSDCLVLEKQKKSHH